MAGRFAVRGPGKLIIAALAIAAVLALAPAAMAQTSAQQGYSTPGGTTETTVSGGAEPQVHAARGGSLPFTGLDVALIVGAGAVLVAMGFGVRALARVGEAA